MKRKEEPKWYSFRDKVFQTDTTPVAIPGRSIQWFEPLREVRRRRRWRGRREGIRMFIELGHLPLSMMGVGGGGGEGEG